MALEGDNTSTTDAGGKSRKALLIFSQTISTSGWTIVSSLIL